MDDEVIRFATARGIPLEVAAELIMLASGLQTRATRDGDEDAGVETTNELPPDHDPPAVGAAERAAPGRPGRVVVTAAIRTRAERFDDRGVLGRGSMGEVRRVFDPQLNRDVAMKVIRPEAMRRGNAVARFVAEAQTTAQLQHPGILPVFEMGTTGDGRLYFTMQEVRGETLTRVIAGLHTASLKKWETSDTGWSLRRVVSAFERVCRAVAYAHSRGVVHRDLKPDNIMVGEHGEILVLDWGLAKVWREVEEARIALSGQASGRETLVGTVAGTPLYMAPEQARGDVTRITAATDVYSLGAILHEILTGRTLYTGRTAKEVLQAILAGPPVDLPLGAAAPGRTAPTIEQAFVPRPVPPDLADACNRAIARDPADRYDDAGGLADDISAWLDGARKRDLAAEIVRAAEAKGRAVPGLRESAARIRDEANARLRSVAPWADETLKAPAWARLSEADRLDRDADQLDVEEELLLHGALTHAPDLVEAHRRLAERYRADHVGAEQRRDAGGVARAENRLHAHVAALPDGDRCRAEIEAYLTGDGTLTVVTEPPGAEVVLHEYVQRNRRLEPVYDRIAGVTPLRTIPLSMGSYLAQLRLEGYEPVNLPVFVRRQEHVGGVRPGGSAPTPIRLPRAGIVAADECFVPPGWFIAGGDDLAPNALPAARVWVDGFVSRRFPVTNREMIVFLDHLVRQGREGEALRWAPRERPAGGEEFGALIYGRRDDGTFVLQSDGEGDAWQSDWPVMMVDWDAARAYATWLAAKTGLPWRLPHELEWEKAARGVDGRFHPWGDTHDASRCHMRESHQGAPMVASVETYPCDVTPYGVRGMAGNVSEWCANAWVESGPALIDGAVVPPPPHDRDDEPLRAGRGGGWFDTKEYVRCAVRRHMARGTRRSDLGFRLVRSA